jgi:hypothetical protein
MGRMVVIGLLVMAVVGVSTPAYAQARDDVGFELGARVGYGVPIGKASDEGTDDLNRVISGQVPLWIDLGVRTNRLFVGSYFQYGLGLLGDEIDEQCEDLENGADAAGNDAGCHVRDLRLGVQFHYHLGKPPDADPWIGLGFGYEWVTHTAWAEVGDDEASIRTTAEGFELLNLQGGVDFLLGPSAALGPFFTWTVSRYDQVSLTCSGDCGDFSNVQQDIDEKSLHHWAIVGARFSWFP